MSRTRVVGGTAKRHREERLLLGGLAIHVDAFKEAIDPIVGKDATIELIDRGVDGVGAAELFEQRRIACVHVHRNIRAPLSSRPHESAWA